MRIVGDAAADPAADGREDMLGLVAVDLDQPLVTDAEVVCNLVQHNVPDLPAEQFRVVSVEALERATVDRDLVREHPAVVTAPSRERHAPVETEQSLPWRRLVFNHDLDVRDLFAKIGWQRVERVLDQALEVRRRALRTAVLHLESLASQARETRLREPYKAECPRQESNLRTRFKKRPEIGERRSARTHQYAPSRSDAASCPRKRTESLGLRRLPVDDW